MHSPESPPQVTPISEEVDNTSDSEASPIPARPEWDAPTVMVDRLCLVLIVIIKLIFLFVCSGTRY